jgi:hypothetical protein
LRCQGGEGWKALPVRSVRPVGDPGLLRPAWARGVSAGWAGGDPEDPSRYDVGPRAENVKVTYLDGAEAMLVDVRLVDRVAVRAGWQAGELTTRSSATLGQPLGFRRSIAGPR